jgi:hypothetical protein
MKAAVSKRDRRKNRSGWADRKRERERERERGFFVCGRRTRRLVPNSFGQSFLMYLTEKNREEAP